MTDFSPNDSNPVVAILTADGVVCIEGMTLDSRSPESRAPGKQLSGAPIRVNPLTGVQTVVSFGGSFGNPFGLVVEPAIGAVPEPSTLTPTALGLASVFAYGCRRRKPAT